MGTARDNSYDADLDFQGYSSDVPVDLPADDFAGMGAMGEPDVDVPPPKSARGKKSAKLTPEPERAPRLLPLRVCVACGGDPSSSGECDHPEVLSMDEAPVALRNAALRLAQLTAERRNQEKLLRKLVADVVIEGRATLEMAPPPPPPTVPVVAVAIDPEVPCPRCGMRPEGVLVKSAPRTTRKSANGTGTSQGLFAFAAPPPVAPFESLPVEAEGQASEAEAKPPRPRRRKPQAEAPAEPVEDAPEAQQSFA